MNRAFSLFSPPFVPINIFSARSFAQCQMYFDIFFHGFHIQLPFGAQFLAPIDGVLSISATNRNPYIFLDITCNRRLCYMLWSSSCFIVCFDFCLYVRFDHKHYFEWFSFSISFSVFAMHSCRWMAIIESDEKLNSSAASITKSTLCRQAKVTRIDTILKTHYKIYKI